jgi:hypothetical protein
MLMTFYPYVLENACWVFDDERTGLKEEAFVFGMTEMISKIVEVKAIRGAAKGFSLTFAAVPFEHDVELTWLSPIDLAKQRNCRVNELPESGNWYSGRILDHEMTGWLCPALLRYFDQAPAKIFVKADPLPAGVDPIWHVKANDPRAEQIMAWSKLFKPRGEA